MGKGKFGGFPGGANMNNMLKQAQKMQADMAKAQSDIEEKVIESSSGGGMVSVKANGKKEILEISIKPEVVDPDDIEMLQDLIVAAVNDVLKQVEAITQQEMGKITGGLNIPGLI
ncbi:MAG: YbaB/EbfC family nucleoid-associated protein [Bacillota bacterium]|nr:YbaB/EbfC family nucleoid-associated protein [Bacillota bacterium]